MNNYKELIVWQKSVRLAKIVHKLTLNLPRDEKYGLTSQIRRSAVSVASNIAEGAGRNSKKEFRNFLGIANGSLNELNTQLEISKRLKILDNNELDEVISLSDEIQKMTYTLIQKYTQI